ncbi:hypothetical protein ACFZAC_26165 [Pseudomonas fluorescens]|uniref:hypothetical protein n=1 Tax=Pseudomonas fluorescens TaxID=294 RepID=UPI003747F38A
MRLRREKEAAAEAAALPADVLAILDEAVIWQRHSGDTERAIVQLPTLSGFMAGPESCAAAVQKLWPELDGEQVELAVKRLAKNVRNYFRQNDKSRTPWASRW